MKRAAYIFLLFILIAIYIFTNQIETLWLLGAFVFFSFLSWVGLFFSKRKVILSFEENNPVQTGIEFVLSVENRSFIPISKALVEVECTNSVFGGKDKSVFHLSVPSKKKVTYNIPVDSYFCGRIDISICKVELQDWLGVIKFKQKTSASKSYYKFPDKADMPVYELVADKEADDALSYRHIKGNDVSEILQIRDYVPGDNVKSIHWKLSARKQEGLIVKELDTPNDNSILIFFDYSNSEEENKSILEIVAEMSKDFLQDAKDHTVIFRNTMDKFSVIEKIDGIDDYEELMQKVLENPAEKQEYQALDYVLENNIVSNYAIIIYITGKSNCEETWIFDQMENVLVLSV
ncbi:MAG: DUF58 domain-containing protein [Agathobacter sp.]|nr:DUF58 domain-containing protein [Agathobacter sp.]